MTLRRGLLWLAAGGALALLMGRWAAGLLADRAFFAALGAAEVWRAGLLTSVAARGAVLLGVFCFAFANLYAVRQSIISLVLPAKVGDLEVPEAIPTRRLTHLALGGALALALLFAFVDPEWPMVALALGGEPFGEIEPYLSQDLGFYVYWLPLERALFSLVSVLLALTSLTVIALYASTPSMRWGAAGLHVSGWVRRHLGVLAGCAILLVGWDWRLDRFGLLADGRSFLRSTVASSFSPYDHRVLLPYLAVVSLSTIPVAVVVALSVWRGQLRIALALLTSVIIAGPVARAMLPLVGGQPRSAEGSRARERPYVATRTLFTARAYGLERVERPRDGQGRGMDARTAARGVSSWDPGALARDAERERGGIGTLATWRSDGQGLRALLLHRPPAGSEAGRGWEASLLLANATDAMGRPIPAGSGSGGGIEGVLVHPGAARYLVVADSTGRMAAPHFATIFERVVQAWDQQNPRLLALEPPEPRPRILTHRDVRARVGRLVPFLRAGTTLTPILHGDSLYWVLELFTSADEYPLAGRVTMEGGSVAYAQHAATAVVHAQTGALTLLPAAVPDAILRTWLKRFPGLFTARSAAPHWMEDALPPAIDVAAIQGLALGVPGEPGRSGERFTTERSNSADAMLAEQPPTFFAPDSAGPLAWGVPLSSNEGLAGLLLAKGGLRPRSEIVRGAPGLDWRRALERLQFAADSAGFGRALPNSVRGRAQPFPYGGGLALAQSFYAWPSDGPVRLAGVVVLTVDGTRAGRTLAEALGQRVAEDQIPPASAEALRTRAAALYDAMRAALRDGDWRAYGEASDALGRLLGRPKR